MITWFKYPRATNDDPFRFLFLLEHFGILFPVIQSLERIYTYHQTFNTTE